MYSVDFDNGITIDFDKEPTPEQISEAYAQYQKTSTPKPRTFASIKRALKNIGTGVKNVVTDIFRTGQEVSQDVAQAQSLAEVPLRAAVGVRDITAGAGRAVGTGLLAGAKTIYDLVTPETIKGAVSETGQEILQSEPVQKTAQTIYDIAQQNPLLAENVGRTLDITGAILPGATRGVTTASRNIASRALQTADETATSLIKKTGENVDDYANRVYNSLIKPGKSQFAYGKDPGRVLAKKGRTANSIEELGTIVDDEINQTGKAISQLSQELSQEGLLTVQRPFQYIDEAINTAAKQNNQTLLSRLNEVKRALGENLAPDIDETGNTIIKSFGPKSYNNITFDDVRKYMREIGSMTKYTGNPSDDSIINQALQNTYRTLRDQSLSAVEKTKPSVAKKFRELTQDYGDLLSADVAIKNREAILARQALLGFSPTISGIGAALITSVVTGGVSIPTILAGASVAALRKLATSTAFKTRLAKMLYVKSPQEIQSLFTKVPALKEIFKTGISTSAGIMTGGAGAGALDKLKNPLRQ